MTRLSTKVDDTRVVNLCPAVSGWWMRRRRERGVRGGGGGGIQGYRPDGGTDEREGRGQNGQKEGAYAMCYVLLLLCTAMYCCCC